MSEKEPEPIYPVKTLHELLSELNREWRRFKRGTLISLCILSTLLVAFALLFLRHIRTGIDEITIIFPIILAAFVIYSIRIMVMQYRFFKKWGHRMEQLNNLEEKLLNDKLAENTPPK
ncbi:MAG: hypothetical protein NWF04_02140 [Candidatus Bathyarchaeota archaeon]|nr:hypothetical protein [Candidatus Bathyarchaeota archaeon]